MIMGTFKVLNDDKLKDKVFIGFVKGEYVDLFTYGERLRLSINDVVPVEII
jgi:hypothetical protein